MKTIKKIISFFANLIDRYEPIISKCNDDNVFAIAGQLAFFMLLSSVPLAMFIVSVLQNLHIPIELLETVLEDFLSEEMTQQVSTFLNSAYESSVGISFITLIITLWSAAQGLHAITNGLNRVYNAYENRNWFFLRLRAMIYTIIFFCIILGLFFIIVFGSTLNNWLSPYLAYLPDIVTLIYNLRFVIIFFFIAIILALIYRNFPNISRELHKEYGFKYQLPGAFLCTVSWYVLSFVISIYVDDFNGFSIYGGLTRLAVIMIWLYFCAVCMMICAEINYIYHKQIKNFELKKFLSGIIMKFQKRKINKSKKQ